jgi:putative exporter of polyketide antibiotics
VCPAATRREAAALAGGVFGIAFVLRVVADGSSATWLRWATPFGWIEEMRPLTGGRPAAILAWIGVLTAATVWLAARRDDTQPWPIARAAPPARGPADRGSCLLHRSDLAGMLQAAINILPAAALFLGVGAVAFAFVPRHTGAAAFGAVALAYLWEQTGALVSAPNWIVAVSPFHWLALAPSEPIDAVASLVLLALALAAATAGVEHFRRRDVVSA